MCDKQKQNKNKKIHNNNSKKCKINRDNIPKKPKKKQGILSKFAFVSKSNSVDPEGRMFQ